MITPLKNVMLSKSLNKAHHCLVCMLICFNQHHSAHTRRAQAFIPSDAYKRRFFSASFAQGICTSITHIAGSLLTDATYMPT